MTETFLCFYNARLVDATTDSPGMLLVEGNRIKTVALGEFSLQEATDVARNLLPAAEIDYIDCQGKLLQPAFIDLHAHFRYPGQSQKEELTTALAAAAAGGFGTLVLMPNTIPAVSSPELVAQVCKDAHQLGVADVIQTITLTKDFSGTDNSHLSQLPVFEPGTPPRAAQVAMATEDGKDVESAAMMLDSMVKCGQRNITVACHSEDMSLAAAARPLRKIATDIFAQQLPLEENALGAKMITGLRIGEGSGFTFMDSAPGGPVSEQLAAVLEDGKAWLAYDWENWEWTFCSQAEYQASDNGWHSAALTVETEGDVITQITLLLKVQE